MAEVMPQANLMNEKQIGGYFRKHICNALAAWLKPSAATNLSITAQGIKRMCNQRLLYQNTIEAMKHYCHQYIYFSQIISML